MPGGYPAKHGSARRHTPTALRRCRVDDRIAGRTSVARASLQRPLTPDAAREGCGLARGHRAPGGRAPSAGSRCQRLDLRPLGLAHGHPARVHRRRSRAADCADDADRPGLVLHPEGRLSERSAPLPAGARRLRGRRGHERLPAGEHRHARDAADVHGHDSQRDLPRRARRHGRPEDLLHRRRNGRLPVPVPLGAGIVRPPARRRARPPGRDRRDLRRRADPARRAGPNLLAKAERPLGEGEARRRHPRPPAGLLSQGRHSPRSAPGSPSSASRRCFSPRTGFR